MQDQLTSLNHRMDRLERDLADIKSYDDGTDAARPAGVSIRKKMPEEVNKGQKFTYQLHVKNASGRTASDVVVSERMHQGMQFVSASPEPKASSPYQWHFPEMKSGETRTIQVVAKANQTDRIKSCATSSFQQRTCASVNVVQPALKLVKSVPSEVMICNQIPLEYTVTNTGTGTAEDVVLQETLPKGLVVGENSRKIRKELGDLSAGQSRTVKLRASAQRTGKFTSRATAAGGDLKARSKKHRLSVVQPALKITKNAPDKKFVGQDFQYKITVRNTGDAPARETVLKDQLPSGVEFVSATGGGERRGSTLRWDLGTIQEGASETVRVEIEGSSKGTATNRAMAKAVCADEVSTTVNTAIQGIPAILLEVVDLEDPIEVGDKVTYRVTATNQGSEDARNVQMAVDFEKQMEYMSAKGPTDGQIKGSTLTFAPLQRLEVGKKATWEITVRAADSASVRLKVKMTSDQLTRPVQETEATNFYK